jgi:hypothetical protein
MGRVDVDDTGPTLPASLSRRAVTFRRRVLSSRRRVVGGISDRRLGRTTMNWRDVFKFLSGAAFAGSLVNFYLWFTGVSVPFLGYTITPTLLGIRSVVSFLAFIAFFYFGWLRK